MGAKSHLNEVYIGGSLAIAGVLGAATGSWALFLVAAVILLGVSLETGKIRK
jgi:hypothetical protein